ncbi:hypothetical protein CUR178_05659 [Leishmania enriettii]|uniref:Trypanosoma Tc-38 (p38) protein domain-containing protein n=1 Tax=Leishmania enriettii TaxID=5663 RepID=A0A836GYK0_LEIEN|nr:hypothetical protein CUR178_05659 [Leishmania enriettii]
MFSVRRVARQLWADYATAQVVAPAAAFRHSRTLRLYANVLTGMERQSTAPLHDRCSHKDNLDAEAERNDAHNALIEGDKSGYPVSVAHADAVANQATNTLSSLFGSSRLSSSAVSATAEGEEWLADAEVLAAHERVRGTEKGWRDVAGCHRPTEWAGLGGSEAVEGGCVSNGEEELIESAEAFADDMEMEKEEATTATVAKVVPQSQSTAAQTPKRAHRQQAANPGAMPYGVGEPVNLYGARYWGSTADTLRRAAEARRFVSPFWSSKAAFERIGATVTAEEEDGVLLHTCMPVAVRLFNLEQTSLAAEHRTATTHEFLAHLRLCSDRAGSWSMKGLETGMRPLDLAGRCFSLERTRAITRSPHFFHFQKQNPYWLSESDMRAIGAAVRLEEMERYALAPIWPCSPFHQNIAVGDTGAVLSGDACPDAATVSVQDRAIYATSAPSMVRHYNVAQLDDPQRFSQLDPVRDKLASCFRFHGTYYAACTTWLMWEYCARYHFPLIDTSRIVFLTMEKLLRLGGSVMTTKRYPISYKHGHRGDGTAGGSSSGRSISSIAFAGASNTPPPPSAPLSAAGKIDVMPACGGEYTSTCSGHNTRGGEDGMSTTATDAGVVPPLFTMEMCGDVVSLCNAMQTDIADLILARVDELRANRFSVRRSQHLTT